MVMEKISDWWNHSIADDVHSYLRLKELSIPSIQGQSPQLGTRRYLVDWLAAICEKFKLCSTARHLAIKLLDVFMDQYDILQAHLKLMTIGCLLVACKFEEKEVNIPKYSELNLYFTEPYSYKTYLNIELQLLNTFEWKVGLPTAAHFSEYYLQHAMDGIPVLGEKDKQKYKMYIAKYVQYFLEISLQDLFYARVTPSLVASAAVAAARLRLNCVPVWTSHLENLTGYQFDILVPVVDQMQSTLKNDEKQQQECVVADMITPPRGPGNPVTPSPINFYQRLTRSGVRVSAKPVLVALCPLRRS